MIETKNKERFFKTEIIASFVEVCYFGGFKYSELLDFASFVTGEYITPSELGKYRITILEFLKETYPELERTLYLSNGDIANEQVINYYKNKYISKYGEYMRIKSMKKTSVKVLSKNTK